MSEKTHTEGQSKPPIGLRPLLISNKVRLVEVRGAISRYFDAKLEIPIEWVEEYNELAIINNRVK